MKHSHESAKTPETGRGMGGIRSLLRAGLAGLIAIVALPGKAADRHWTVEESLGASVNGLGVQHAFEAKWTRSITASTQPLRADAHIAAGATHVLTPAFTRLGAWGEISPLSIVAVRVGAEKTSYFGTFGSLQSFADYDDSFDDDTRRGRKSEAAKGSGSRLFVSPTLRLRAGSFVAISTAEVEWWRTNASGPYYYEPARDTLLRTQGDRVLVVSTMVLRMSGTAASGQTGYGVRHSLTRIPDAPRNRSQRIGVFLTRQLGSTRWRGRAPRIAGHVSYYLDDPNRRGQLGAGLGLSFRLLR